MIADLGTEEGTARAGDEKPVDGVADALPTLVPSRSLSRRSRSVDGVDVV